MPTPEELRKRFEESLGGGTKAPTTTPTPSGGSSRLNLSDKGDIQSRFNQRIGELTADLPREQDKSSSGILGALDFASSGKTFLRRISGGRLNLDKLNTPLPDAVDSKLRGAIDLTFNPLTAASVIAAPIAVPARVAANPLSRLAWRLGAETVAGAVGNKSARIVAERLPEDSPSWMKMVAPLGAAVAGAGVTSTSINRALNPKTATNLYLDELKQTAAASGYKHLAPLQRLEEIQRGFAEAGNPVTRRLFTDLGIDPVVGESTEAGRAFHAYARQKAVAREASQVSMAAALPRGFDAFEVADGQLANLPRARGLQWNDVFSDPEAPRKYGFSPEQTAQWQTAVDILEDGRKLLADNGVEVSLKEMGEALYIPRQVAVGKGERPSSPFLARIYDEATEAVKQSDVKYLDPTDTFRLHIETVYKTVADQQFSDLVEQLTVAPSKAYGATARGKALSAKHREAVERFRKESRQEGVLTDRSKRLRARISEARREFEDDDPRIVQLMKQLADNETLVKESRDRLTTLRRARTTTRQSLQKDFKSFRQSDRTRLPGSMFGRSDDVIDVEKWKNSFIPKDEHEVLAKWFDTQRGRLLNDNPSKPMRVVADVGAILRTTSATADFSMPFVQGYPLLATDPVAWSKMAAQHYMTFLRPGTANRYIQKNRDLIQDMVVNGRVPAGDVEFFTAARDGAYQRVAQQLEKAPGGGLATAAVRNTAGKALTKFERSYNAGLLAARAELWRSYRPWWPGTAEELGSYIRNLTGGMDTAALGVGQSQRALESLAFFSPKLLRSTAALFAKATRPWTNEGAEAAHTIMRLMSASAGIFVLANIAEGTARGESDAEINARVQKVLSPWEGKEFLSVRVGDEWYGVGGQVRAMSQFVANSIVGFTNDFGLTDEDTGATNPLTAFIMNRVSPAVRAGTASLEYLTDEKLNLLPFDTIDSVPDLLGSIGTSGLPFVVQGFLEAGEDPLRDAFETGTFKLGLADILGLRSSPISPFEARDDEVQKVFDGLHYRDLTPAQKTVFDKAHPELTKAAEEFGDLAQREYNARVREIDALATGTLEAVARDFAGGRYQSRAEMREDIEDTLTARAIKLQEARTSAGLDDELSPTTTVGKLLNAYYYTFELARRNPEDPSSPLDFAVLDQLQGTLMGEVDRGLFGAAEEARRIIDERRRFQMPEALASYMANKDLIQQAGYWDSKDRAFDRLRERVNAMPGFEDVASAGEFEARILHIGQSEPRAAAQAAEFLKEVNAISGKEHEVMRRQNPALDRALYENGYTTTRLTRD